MAGRTRCQRLRVIDESIIAPRRRLVAAFAIIRRRGMRQHRSQAGKIDRIVAAETPCRRILEPAIEVARRAGDAEMRAGQWEAGRSVIERRTCRGLRVSRWSDEQRCRRRDDGQYQTQRSQRDHPHPPRAATYALLAVSRSGTLKEN